MKVFHSIFALSVLKYLIRRCNACNICIFNISFKALTYRQRALPIRTTCDFSILSPSRNSFTLMSVFVPDILK